MKTARCPALLISAPASNQGKTTITAALARYHRNQGLDVRVFKTGPDFLDPMILERASGNRVYQLDLWMTGEEHSRNLLYQAASEADLILVEGVMGLFDGTPSSADLAEFFGIPVLAIINAWAMAQTFAAIAHGLASFRPSLPFAGVLANQVANDYHADLLLKGLPETIHAYGALMRDDAIDLPHRHLGLVQAEELDNLEPLLDQAAIAIGNTGLAKLPEAVTFKAIETTTPEPILQGQRIGIARDEAFAFIYPGNTDLLQEMGAELIYFSPLTDVAIPEVDSLYLPGGYPELHLETLENNHTMSTSIQEHHNNHKPIYAECGGMLYLLNEISDKEGSRGQMLGLIPGHAQLQNRLAALGFQRAVLPAGELRGHTFHHSKVEIELTPYSHGIRQRGDDKGEAIYREAGITASYLHLYFPSNPTVAASLFQVS